MKYSFSSPSITNKEYKNNKFDKEIKKLLLHNLNDSEPKAKVLSKIQKIIKTDTSLYNNHFNFNYNKEYHLARNHIRSFDKIQKSKKDIINFLRNENKQFKKIFQTNSKEFKTLSFNSLNRQKNLKKTLSLLINNNYENNIFIESPLLMSNNKEINVYYSNYDENNDNVYKDKKTNIPIIDEENDESIKFSQKLLGNLNGRGRVPVKRKTTGLRNELNPIFNLHLSSKFINNDENFWLKNRKKYKELMKEISKENLEIKKYNSSIRKILNEINRSKRHSTRYKNQPVYKGIRNSNLSINTHFNIDLKGHKFERRKSVSIASPEKQNNSLSIFDKLFKDILKKKKYKKEESVSHLESIYDDILKTKDKFLSYKIDKKFNLQSFRKKNKYLIEKEKNEDKKIENLDYELLWRFHNYNKFKD